MQRSKTQRVVDSYRAEYWQRCAPLGLRCETCRNWMEKNCLCPVTPEPSTYDNLSSRWRYYHGDPNEPEGFISNREKGWYRYVTDGKGGAKFEKLERTASEYQWLEYDPDYENNPEGVRRDRGPGFYKLSTNYDPKIKWEKKRGGVQQPKALNSA